MAEHAQCIELPSSQVLSLNAPGGAKWEIDSGSLAVFLCELERDDARFPLLTLQAGDLLPALPHDAGAKYGISVVALEPVRLRYFDAEQARAQIAADPAGESRRLLNSYQRITGAIPTFDEARSDVAVSGDGEQTVVLQAGQAFRAPRNNPVWVRVESGEALFMGQEGAVVNAEFAPTPAVSRIWLVAKGEVRMRVSPELAAVGDGAGQHSVLREYFSNYLETIAAEYAQQQRKRFRLRDEQIQNRLDAATERIGRIQDDHLSAIPADWPALAKACAEIGRYQGISIKPPLEVDQAHGDDAVLAIARASGVRVRRVALDDRWQHEAVAPLLAFENQGESAPPKPVALLPLPSGGYELHAPDCHPVKLDQARSEKLARSAYVFYTPLPPGAVTVRSLLQMVWRTGKRSIVGIVAYGLAVSLLSLSLPEANKRLVEDAIPAADGRHVMQIGLALFAIVVSITLFAITQGLATLRLNGQVDYAVQSGLMDRVLRLSTDFFRRFSTGDLALRVLAMQQIQSVLSASTIKAILSSVVSVATLVVLFRYSPPLALAALVLAAISYAVTIYFCARMYAIGGTLLEARGRNFGLVVELICGISKLRVAGAERRAYAFWTEQYAAEKESSTHQRMFQDRMEMILGMMSTLSLLAVLAIGAPAVQQYGGMSTGQFLAFYFALGQFMAAVSGLCQHAQSLVSAMNLWKRAQPVLEAEPETAEAAADPGLLRGSVEIDRVSFRYVAHGALILDNVSLSIQPGQFVAIVGPSGCGKSTLLRLLLGFEKPGSGALYYDGQDLLGLDLGALRRQVGVVLQNGRISGGTIFENIQAGGILTRAGALEAATLAAFDKDLEQMPMGLHTVLSDGGETLSGGQRQRLLIARALAHKPKMIYMDEATSALDNETQRTVSQSMDKLKATRVVIAHRLSTIRNADYIYVMDKGRVVQQGIFAALMAEEGMFKRLIQRQIA